MPSRFVVRVVAAFLVALSASCATSQAGSNTGADPAAAATPTTADQAAENTIRVEVNQNRPDAGTTTIYLEPAAGVRTTLGTIAAGERKTFNYGVEAANRTVRLIALTASGQTIRSTEVTVPRGAGLSWDLQINSVRVRR